MQRFKRTLLLLLALAGFGWAAVFAQSTDNPAAAEPKLFIVMLKPGADQDTCANDHQIIRRRIFRHAFNGFDASLDSATAASLKADDRVLAVVEDSVCAKVNTQTVSSGVRRMGLDHFPLVSVDGSGKQIDVNVAVVDTVIETNHPDLNIVQAVDFTGQGLVTSSIHATFVACVLAALDNNFGVVGVAPGAHLWSVRVVRENGVANMSDLVAGLDYVAAHASQIDVCNISLGSIYGGDNSGLRPLEQAAIQSIVNAGVVVVAATGNDGADIAGPDGILDNTDDTIPAGFPEVMAVSAVDPATEQLANFSNFSRKSHATPFVHSPGGAIDVALPGVDIFSSILNGNYEYASGTSIAAPHASGLVALYIATHGRATNAAGVYRIRQAIVDAAWPQNKWNAASTFDADANHEALGIPSIAWVTNAPNLVSITKTGAAVGLQFTTLTGYSNTLQFAPSLSPSATWSNLFSTNGTGGLATVTNTRVSTNRFYRLATTPVWNPLLTNTGIATNIGSLGASANGNYFGTSNHVAGALVNDNTNFAFRINAGAPGSRLRIPYQPAFNPSNEFSIEIWCKPSQTNWEGNVVSSEGISNNISGGWFLSQSDPARSAGTSWYFQCFNTSGNGAYTYIYSTAPVVSNVWYHLVGTFDGTNVAFYINGSSIASFALPAGQHFRPNAVSPFNIGEEGRGGHWLPGADFDECALYTNTLSAARVLAHYQNGTNATRSASYQSTVLADKPIGYWRLNEQ